MSFLPRTLFSQWTLLGCQQVRWLIKYSVPNDRLEMVVLGGKKVLNAVKVCNQNASVANHKVFVNKVCESRSHVLSDHVCVHLIVYGSTSLSIDTPSQFDMSVHIYSCMEREHTHTHSHTHTHIPLLHLFIRRVRVGQFIVVRWLYMRKNLWNISNGHSLHSSAIR